MIAVRYDCLSATYVLRGLVASTAYREDRGIDQEPAAGMMGTGLGSTTHGLVDRLRARLYFMICPGYEDEMYRDSVCWLTNNRILYQRALS